MLSLISSCVVRSLESCSRFFLATHAVYQNLKFTSHTVETFLLDPVYTGPDKLLHGRILFLNHRFTWIRANSVAVAFKWVQSQHPGKNVTRFQALTVLSKQKVARFGCLHESVRNRKRAGQKVDLLFSGPKLAHLAVQNFVEFRRFRVKARWNSASFCPYKNLSGPV